MYKALFDEGNQTKWKWAERIVYLLEPWWDERRLETRWFHKHRWDVDVYVYAAAMCHLETLDQYQLLSDVSVVIDHSNIYMNLMYVHWLEQNELSISELELIRKVCWAFLCFSRTNGMRFHSLMRNGRIKNNNNSKKNKATFRISSMNTVRNC